MNLYTPGGDFLELEEGCTEFSGAASNRMTLDEMNATLTVVRFGGKVKIAAWTDSPVMPGVKVPQFFDVSAMRNYFANRFVRVQISQTQTKDMPVFDVWLKHPDSPRADGITLAAEDSRFVDGALNLWTGLAVKPKPGGWPLLRKHIEEVICGGEDEAQYVLNWCAWTLQNPVLPSEVAIVMRGGKGAGKGVIGNLLRNIFGAHGLQISNPKHLVGSFNSHLMHTCLLFADEALWAGDKPSEGVLKRMITEPTLTIEPKGIDSFEAPNRLSLIMASNEAWVVPASLDERRFAVFDVSNSQCGNRDYFDALHKEIYESGGAAAFVHDMLAMPLDGWHPRFDIPQTAGLREQQIESANPEVHWLWSLLEDGELPGLVINGVRVTELLDMAKKSHGKLRDWFSRAKLARLVEKVGAIKIRKSDAWYYVFPPLAEARKKFMAEYPGFEPFSEDDDAAQWSNAIED
jgi:hypothetical protein